MLNQPNQQMMMPQQQNQQSMNPAAFTSFGNSELKRSGIQKFSAPMGQSIIKILTKELWFKYSIHYSDAKADNIGLGYFHCFGGSCCKDYGLSDERFAVPIVRYTGTTYQYGEPLEFCYLPVKYNRYQELINLENLSGDITNYDILINCTDTQYQNFTMMAMTQAASFISGQNAQYYSQKINDFLQEWSFKIEQSIASKKYDENTYALAKHTALQNKPAQVQFVPNHQMSQLPTFNQPQFPPQQPQPQFSPPQQQFPPQNLQLPQYEQQNNIAQPINIQQDQPAQQLMPQNTILPEQQMQPAIESLQIINSAEQIQQPIIEEQIQLTPEQQQLTQEVNQINFTELMQPVNTEVKETGKKSK